MATVNLGSIKFKWKGTYSGATAYTIDDVVEYNGSSYICILASTGNLPTNATYFEQMSSAGTNGTNGTDLTTTLTTQGDLVYRDGSGLQRLGAGTSGQVLQTGGAGANPSWVDAGGSGFELLGSTTASSSASISFDGFYTSDYDVYEIYGTNIVPDTNSVSMRWRVRSGNADLTSNYIGGYNPNMYLYYDGSGYYNHVQSTVWNYPSFSQYTNFGFRDFISLTGSYTDGSAGDDDNPYARYRTNETGHNINWKITAYNPLSSRNYKHYKIECVWNTNNHNNIGKSMGMNGYFSNNATTSAHSGISFFPNNGNLTSGKIYVYGLRNN